MNKDLSKIKGFFEDRILSWMIADLKKSIKAETNFLTALGCLVYTEVIGNFLPQLEIKEKGKDEERCFYRCLFRLKSRDYLIQLDRWLRKETKGKGIYHHFRHNMAHLYLPKVGKGKKSERVFIPIIIARDGIGIDPAGEKTKSPPIAFDKQGRIFLAFKNYTEELEEAHHRFYKEIFNKQNPKWVKSAMKGFDVVTRGR